MQRPELEAVSKITCPVSLMRSGNSNDFSETAAVAKSSEPRQDTLLRLGGRACAGCGSCTTIVKRVGVVPAQA